MKPRGIAGLRSGIVKHQMERSKGWIVAAIMATVFVATNAQAQGRFDAQQFNPMPSQFTNHFGLASAAILERGQWELHLLTNYADDTLVLRNADGERLQSIIEGQLTLNFMGAIGIADILDIGFDVPLIALQNGEEISRIPADVSAAGFGIGDVRLVPKFQLFNSHDPDESPGGGAIAFLINGFIPTGNDDEFQGEGFRIEPRFVFDIITRLGSRISINAGYMLREPATLAGLDVNDTLTYGVGFDVRTSEMFHLLFEFAGEASLLAEEIDTSELPLEGLMGFKIFPIEQFILEFGAGMGLVEGFGTPDWRVFLGLGTSIIPDRDPDHDGLYGDDDQCPYDPEDFDGFEDTDGCPDVDNDEDGILDVYDECPMDPEDVDGFEDEDGCPDRDNDADSILDVDDECPLDPEDYDTYEDSDGCPDVDNDADGLLDVEDECPLIPEDFDGFEDEDGCPDPDNDQDRILDVDDSCPLDPEVWNGFEDEDGCPDEGLITVTCEQIEISDKVYFESDSDVIRSRSFELLNTIARLLTIREDLRLVRIEGHTDDRGSDSYNLDLSDRRAASVRRYLLEAGVPASRLLSQGFGEANPIDTNGSRDGRANNRRVEFHIVEQEGCTE